MTICSRWFVTIAELRSRCRVRAATLYERRAVLTDVGRFVKTEEKATTSPATDCSTTNHRHETSSLSTVSAPQRFKVPAIFLHQDDSWPERNGFVLRSRRQQAPDP